jgi:hypothetical protein
VSRANRDRKPGKLFEAGAVHLLEDRVLLYLHADQLLVDPPVDELLDPRADEI